MLSVIALSFLFTQCSEDDQDATPTNPTDPLLENFQLIGTATIDGHSTTLEIYAQESLFAGYNRIALRPLEGDNGAIVEGASLRFKPMMQMNSGMMHATPFENPTYDEDLQAYVGTVTFIMPSTDMGNWTLEVAVEEPGDTARTFSQTIEVEAREETRVISFISNTSDSTRYFVAMISPTAPEVGINDFGLVIYKREDMMTYPPVEDLLVKMEPEMPTMGHGSPNNEDPTHQIDGYYWGFVNFTMTGYWKVNLTFTNGSGEVVNNNAFFDITFQ